MESGNKSKEKKDGPLQEIEESNGSHSEQMLRSGWTSVQLTTQSLENTPCSKRPRRTGYRGKHIKAGRKNCKTPSPERNAF